MPVLGESPPPSVNLPSAAHDAEELLDPCRHTYEVVALHSDAWLDTPEVDGAYRFVRQLLAGRPARRSSFGRPRPARPASLR